MTEEELAEKWVEKEYDELRYEKCERKDFIFTFHELKEMGKQAFLAGLNSKTQWHDLRKNPDDLPKENNRVMLCYCCNGYHSNIGNYVYRLYTKQEFLEHKVVAWCEIPQFRDKESIMFEKESDKYFRSVCENYNEEYERTGKRHYFVGFDIKNAYIAGYNKANEWHYMKDVKRYEDLPQNEDVYYAYVVNVGAYDKPIIERRLGCFAEFEYDVMAYHVIAWKEIVLPELKEIEQNDPRRIM